ncbi:MAG: thioredoxin family protein [Chloroflexota bacterium]
MLEIKVLGPGCPNCAKVEDVAKRVVANLGIEAQIVKITDTMEIMNYNVLPTPGLVINDKLFAAGRIPSATEVTSWVTSALETA